MSDEKSIATLSDIERMASAIAKSNLFGVKTTDQAIALMLIAQAEGLHPAIAARDYDIIQGRPAKKSEAMLRSFLESGGKVKWHQLDDSIADATFSHPAGGEVRISWDMKRATAAGLDKNPTWKKYPRQMLRARTVSEGVRTVCPMATGGMYVPEEVKDMEPDPQVIEVESRTEENKAKPRRLAAIIDADVVEAAPPVEVILEGPWAEGYVDEIKIKPTKNGGTCWWAKINGQSYSTFSKTQGGILESCKEHGSAIRIKYNEQKVGMKTFFNIEEIQDSALPAKSQEAPLS